jgi:RimJ/RimL family protein N-acetyltransferase
VDVPTLSGRWVTLEPLSERHRKPLARAADDHRIWATTIVRADGDAFDGWFAAALADRAAWYHPDTWGTTINPKCKLLLLTHAFEALAMQQVAFVTDVLNQRSQAAIAKLGATRRGPAQHMLSQGGRMRDSVVFSTNA